MTRDPVDPSDPFGPAVERSIRAGAPPTPEVIARMAAAHTATLGVEGRDGAATGLVEQLVGLGPLARVAAFHRSRAVTCGSDVRGTRVRCH